MSAEGKSLVGRSGGILPKKIVKFGGYETLFSALFMGYVSEKSTSNMKMANNCKSSQVTIIKITKSTENDSIDRLLMCPAQQVQGAAAPLPPH